MAELGKTGYTPGELDEIDRLRKGKVDVVTIARACREGKMGIDIVPMANGWMVRLVSYDASIDSTAFVATKGSLIGTFVHRLFNANLDSPQTAKGLRTFMGY